MKKLFLFCLVLIATSYVPATAQNSEEPIDEVISRGIKKQNDPAMSAYLAGDFETAEIEFERNAFCALRAIRGFRSGVESARDSTIRADVGTDANIASQPIGGQGGATITPSAPTTAPSGNLKTSDFEKNEAKNKRTCEDRGFQLYMAGLSQLKLGKMDEAKESFERAIVLRKTIHDAHFRLALLEYQDGNLKKANKQYKQLKRLEARCKRCEFKEEIKGQVQYLSNILG